MVDGVGECVEGKHQSLSATRLVVHETGDAGANARSFMGA